MEKNENLREKNRTRMFENREENFTKLKTNISSQSSIPQTHTVSENTSFETVQNITHNSDSRVSNSSGSSDSDEENNKLSHQKNNETISSNLDECDPKISLTKRKKIDSEFDSGSHENNNKKHKAVCQSEVEDKNISTENESSSKPPVKFVSIVAEFYNSIYTLGEGRCFSKIWHLRNFNNWIKSHIIDDSVTRLQNSQYYRSLKVLDMCCGKGGDIIKWLKLNVRYLVMTDIAEVSLKECKERFSYLLNKIAYNSDVKQEIILADCTRDRLRSKYVDPSIQFDIVSCQFSFHYCFESLPQAECMLKNASECLKPGGYFIGTLPNADEIVKRLTLDKTTRLGNSIFSLEMMASKPYALFGAKYKFKLEGVVDCPEFLVHFPTFVKLAGNFGLKLVEKKRFDEIYEEKKKTSKGEALLRKMNALEMYPPSKKNSCYDSTIDYAHAKIVWEMKRSENSRLGTLSKSEWEVITLYHAFIFQKQKTQ